MSGPDPEPFAVVPPDEAQRAAPGDRRIAERLLRAAVLRPDVEDHRRTALHLLATHPDALRRTNVTAHLTGSAVVVDAERRRCLLMLHRKLGRWFQPGGHADDDGNLVHVAWREATEETGIDGLAVVAPAIDVDVHEVRPPGEPSHLHVDLRFLALAPAGAEARANHESDGLRWVDLAELAQLEPTVDPSTRRLVGIGLGLASRQPWT